MIDWRVKLKLFNNNPDKNVSIIGSKAINLIEVAKDLDELKKILNRLGIDSNIEIFDID